MRRCGRSPASCHCWRSTSLLRSRSLQGCRWATPSRSRGGATAGWTTGGSAFGGRSLSSSPQSVAAQRWPTDVAPATLGGNAVLLLVLAASAVLLAACLAVPQTDRPRAPIDTRRAALGRLVGDRRF